MELNYAGAFAAIGVLGFFCQWLAWRLKLPAILFLLLAGIASGALLGWLNPDDLFGEMLFPVVSLSVAIILFEGSLTLKKSELTGIESAVWRMVTVGIVISWLTIAVFTQWLFDLDWHLAVLFGALVVVTGPTVIGPMLRTVRPNARITNILRWESILIDPLGALLAVLVFDFIVVQAQGGNEWVSVALIFGKIVAIGVALGCGAGYLVGVLLRRQIVPEYLHNFFTLVSVVAVFSLSDYLEHESGLLAVTIMGIWLANMKNVEMANILDFKESLSVVLISGLFILLAARVDLNELLQLSWQAVALLLFVQFVARPAKIALSTLGGKIPWREKVLIAWIGPRGIVAAAVSALFALRLDQMGVENANLLVTLTFVVIIGTVVLQSLTTKPLAKLLNVVEEDPQGVLIVGANIVARTLGKALKDNGYDVLLADSYRTNIHSARMKGLRVFPGSPISRLAERELNLLGIGRLLGLSQNEDLNTLAAQRYQIEFGKENVYALGLHTGSSKSDRHLVADTLRGSQLFGANFSYGRLASLIAQGAEVRSTNISKEFGWDAYDDQYGNSAIPLFIVRPNKRLEVLTERPTADKVVPGCKIIALVSADKVEEKMVNRKASEGLGSSPNENS